ncbi:MAG: sugar ABC transporter ATP-binding protein, partial [Verrucomicrobiales bacterium]|nr:sugar ABC transporter ATP-binding protein [Verrucomicrobiales bacterium]
AEGMGLVSEDRKAEGLLLGRSIADNLTLTRFGPLTRFGWVRGGEQMRLTADWMQRLDVRAREPGQAVGELSGGNQQKVAIGRLLHHDARILLLDEPTRGIDVGSKAQIYRLMGEWAAAGRAVVFVSSYLPELMGVCHTLGVMCRGVLSAIRPVSEWTEHTVMAAAVGQGPGEGADQER